MNKKLVWTICAVNILLVAFLTYRVTLRPASPVRFSSSVDSAEASSTDWAARSREARESLLAVPADADAGDRRQRIAEHPRLGSTQWSEEAGETLRVFLETVDSTSGPLERMQLREIVFDRFGGAPQAVDGLAAHAEGVLSGAETAAERRGGLILLFRLLLNEPSAEEARPAALDHLPSRLRAHAEDHSTLLPTLVEGWGILQDRGLDTTADEIFQPEEIRPFLEDPSTDRELFLQALANASRIVPDWGSEHYRPWLADPDPRIRRQAWNELLRTADAETLDWLAEWRPADPDLDLRRLRALMALKDKWLTAETDPGEDEPASPLD